MNILNKFLKQSIKCQVKIGSNFISTHVNKQTSGKDLLTKCLSRCKLTNFNNIHKNYSLIEKCNGIGRLVHHNENIFDLIKDFQKKNILFELIIKKSVQSKKMLMSIKKNKKYVHKVYKILNKEVLRQNIRNESHFYEDIHDLSYSHHVSIEKNRPKRVVYSLKTIQNIRRKLQTKKIFDQEFIL